MRKLSFAGVILTILFSILGISYPTTAVAQSPEKIAPSVQQALQVLNPGEMVSVIVVLRDKADLPRIPNASRAARQKASIIALQSTAEKSQKQLISRLEAWKAQGSVYQFTPFWIFNGFEVTATAEVINTLADQFEVAEIRLNNTIPEPELSTAATSSPETNLTLINAPSLWNAGWRGQGVVVATMDSGVDMTHPDLEAQYRGGTNSWFDPYGENAAPADISGHGTQVMGVMVGRDTGGTAIGVAPDAQWIAVKIFNNRKVATTAGIHAGFQWLLDPDGNPNTDDAPDVVNNSWSIGTSPGCDLEFQPDLQALLAAGILPVFSAGNYGSPTTPLTNTAASPANYPEAFAVGAIDISNAIYSESSRGPSACGEQPTIFPELVAPGVNIKTTDLFSMYALATGTSISAPHVAGGLALLLSAFPKMDVTLQRSVLITSATRLTGDGQPDNNTGYGRLDLFQAYNLLSDARIAASASAPAVKLYQPLTYTVAITYQGTTTATITATGTFSGTAIDISQVQSGQGGCSFDADSFSCALGSMPNAESGGTLAGIATTSITVVTHPQTSGTLTQTVIISSNVVEASSVNNFATITTAIEPFTIFLPIVMKG